MSRGRINASASVPESGASKVSANSIVVWDEDADPNDVEEAIKEAARRAVRRYRDARAGACRASTSAPAS